MPEIELEVFYPYPIEYVWSALTEPDALSAWLMENDFKPVKGHKFKFRDKPKPGWDGIGRCEVLEIDKPHKLSWSQCGNDEGKDPFIIVWTLKSESNGTRVAFTQDGFKGLRGLFFKKLMGVGWKRMLNQRIPLVLKYAGQKGWHDFPKGRKITRQDC